MTSARGTPGDRHASPPLSPKLKVDVGPRRLLGDLRSDPARAPETFVIYAVAALGGTVHRDMHRLRELRPDASLAELSSDIATSAARRAAVEGAVSGAPLYLALVPAYVTMLMEQARMVLRIAALHGWPPDDARAAAELLTLTGVYGSPESARRAIDAKLASTGHQARPHGHGWIGLARSLLVLAGFIEPKELRTPRGRLKGAIAAIVAAVVWAATWILPLTFVLLMAWSCESATDKLSGRALRRYGEPAAASHWSPGRGRLWALAVLGSAALPAALLFAAAQWHPLGIGFVHVLVPLAGIALVLGVFACAGAIRDSERSGWWRPWRRRRPDPR